MRVTAAAADGGDRYSEADSDQINRPFVCCATMRVGPCARAGTNNSLPNVVFAMVGSGNQLIAQIYLRLFTRSRFLSSLIVFAIIYSRSFRSVVL